MEQNARPGSQVQPGHSEMSTGERERGGARCSPALTHADYARMARQTDEQILRACAVETFHASGPGGQGVNTADSAVRMRHEPSGIVVTARAERSQLLNRQACLAKLRAEFVRRAERPRTRKKTHVPHRAKERRLASKHATSEKKRLRGRPSVDD